MTLIAAVAENFVIGKDGELPWRLPADLAFFQRTTDGHTMLMGRRTYESTGVLPRRTTIVLTSDESLVDDEEPRENGGRLLRAASYEEGIARAREMGETELFVCGGAGVYRRALEDGDRLLLTRVAASPDGDTKFPEPDWSRWTRVGREEYAADERHACDFAFEEWVREP